ncbi:MAG: diacylglycerol kinase family protein [Chloroflexota bacterium]
MSVPHARVIVNPVAGAYSVRKEWPRISQQLHAVGLSFDHVFTAGAGHAVELARLAADSGYRYIIAVGGDGTVNEVVNGLLNSIGSHNTILGILNFGTAGSFARSLGIAQDVGACSHLTEQRRVSIDVGLVKCWRQGQPIESFFINVADVGFGSAVADAWKRLPNRFGRNINLIIRTFEGLRRLSIHRNRLVKLQVGDEVATACSCDVVIANGQYFANGMQIAPHAKLDDGLFDVVTVGDVSKSELLKIWPTLYRGDHIHHPKIRERKAANVTIESDEPLLVEADGVIFGETPASFRVLPSALTVVV